MKSILISIKPKYVAKILNGEKTIEIRKTMPKCELPIDVYIYCTKDKDDGLLRLNGKRSYYVKGKVVAKFTLNKVEEIPWQIGAYELDKQSFSDFLDKCCLDFFELKKYLNKNNGYAWHIDNLEIFDKPKDLSEFKKCQLLWNCEPHDCKTCRHSLSLTKAPQSWCYVEVE